MSMIKKKKNIKDIKENMLTMKIIENLRSETKNLKRSIWKILALKNRTLEIKFFLDEVKIKMEITKECISKYEHGLRDITRSVENRKT